MTTGAIAKRGVAGDTASERLFERIGAFLEVNRLGPDPIHYAFAYQVLSDANGSLAKRVSDLTDGGVRLTRSDIESLGGQVVHAAATGEAAQSADRVAAEGLVAQTQMQVEGFSDMVQAIRAETQGFGRDLAASADAIRAGSGNLIVDDVVQITGAMLDRVRSAESRLEAATHEATELRAKLEEARDNARRDPLTGLPNRRAYEEAYAAQTAADTPLCVAVCDVDRFKLVNDRFGHAVGDRVLKVIADALLKACPGHLVARYGGEEFAVLFTGVSRNVALATLDEARRTVAAKRYRLRESDEPLGEVTFSAGLTETRPDEPFGSVFARADALLYRAKDSGRNKLVAG